MHMSRPSPAETGSDARFQIQRDGQYKTLVVVCMFADQVHAARRAETSCLRGHAAPRSSRIRPKAVITAPT